MKWELAIIAAVEKVRETAREARSKAVEEAARRLSDEAEEGLWLMECFEILEPTEQRSTDHDKIEAKKRKSGREEEEGTGEAPEEKGQTDQRHILSLEHSP